jgi:tetratricopeptide (TPR) repeat protein
LDKTLIYQAIENPAMRKAISIEELEKIQKSYPYFSTAHVLLAKMYQEKNDHRFADQLQQAALYVNNRHVLYDYIKDSQFSILDSEKEEFEIQDSGFGIQDSEFEIQDSEFENSELEISDSKFEIRNSELEIRNSELEVSENSEIENSKTEAVASVMEDLELRIANFESRIANLELGIENTEPTAPVEETLDQNLEVVRAKDLDPMEANFIIEAVHSTIELEAGEDTIQIEGDTAPLDVHSEVEETEAASSTPMTYAEYMMAKARKMKGEVKNEQAQQEEEQETDEIDEAEEEKTEEQSFESRISNFESSARRIQKPSVVEVQKSIIDKFIQQQPKITPGKAAEYTNTQNLGKDSLEEDMTFVTETMAKLYAAQGKIDKAKKVYRQLIALHPEKSIYFAAQLKNLNQNKKI